MPFRLFRGKKDAQTKSKNNSNQPTPVQPARPTKPTWTDAWARKTVHAEEVRELHHVCIQELKSRDMDMPFLLLPFRPNSDISAAKSFIRGYFKTGEGPSSELTGGELQREIRLLEPLVLCSIVKWCWSRLSEGIIGWSAYELFHSGERESYMAKNAFDVFLPIALESSARQNIALDFFDFLASVAANGKNNGLGGRKLSRLAGWWAFPHVEVEAGFDGGYKSWARAADATSHLFFAYLRSKAPDEATGTSGISQLPRSLLALVSQTEYPPETPILLQRTTAKVVMIVEKVSPTPYALLFRANTFDYEDVRGDVDPALVRFGDCEDPVQALTFESRRVLDAISSANASVSVNHQTRLGEGIDSSWSQFESMGFGSMLDGSQTTDDTGFRGYHSTERMRNKPMSGRNEFDRPTTPSWADFLSSGFGDDATKREGGGLLKLPPDQVLPPITPPRVQSSQSHVRHGMRSDNLDPPELNATSHMELDETFWWVWMSSLADEETDARKAVFGRCAFIETEPKVTGGGWLILEEQVKGAAAPLKNDVQIVEKKSRFTFGRKSRQRRGSTGKKPPVPKNDALKAASSPALTQPKPSADQEAKMHQAAANLVREQQEVEDAKSEFSRRGRRDEGYASKTNSIMTLGIGSKLKDEAGPAMQWARKYDKDTIRDRYLGDPNMGTGTGTPRAYSMASTMDLISATKPALEADKPKERDLPPTPEREGKLTAPKSKFYENISTPTLPKHIASQTLEEPQHQEKREPSPRVSESKHRDKLDEKSPLSPSDPRHLNRKPVSDPEKAPIEQHPAFRKSTERKPVNGSTGQPKPAAAAAQAAMKKNSASNAPTSPTKDTENLQRSKVGSTRKIRNLFTRKKDEPDIPEALAMQRAISSKQTRNTLRKPRPESRQEDRPPTVPEKPTQPTPEPVRETPEPPQHVAENDFDGGPGPEVEEYDQEDYEEHHPEVDNTNRSTAHFSNFTSGPLEDQPAFAGEDEAYYDERPSQDVEEETGSGSAERHFNTQTAQRLFGNQEQEQQPTREEFATPMEMNPNDEAEHGLADEEPSPPEHIPPPPSKPPPIPKDLSEDRWKQIRQNAAERRQDRTEAQSHASRASAGAATEKTMTTDDGETSGEESIESRVARIRARVAQLTSNQQNEENVHQS